MRYTIGSFLDNDQVLISEKLFNQTNYPFTNERVHNFFRHFYFLKFSSDQIVKSIFLTDGAMKPPNCQWALESIPLVGTSKCAI